MLNLLSKIKPKYSNINGLRKGMCTLNDKNDPIVKFINHANKEIPRKNDLGNITRFQTYVWSGFVISLLSASGIVWIVHKIKIDK